MIALGFFDGVHLGHQQIIQTAKKKAIELNVPLAVMTFYPHPSKVIKPDQAIEQFLTPLPVKQKRFAELGVDQMVIVEFDKAFASLSHQEFVEQYICGLQCKHVVAGFDFTYGCRGLGNMNTIVKDGKGQFGATTVEKLEHNNQKIGSTQIRECLNEGRVEEIAGLLGSHFQVDGIVEQSLSPNVIVVLVNNDYWLPCQGFYKVEVTLDKEKIEGLCYVEVGYSSNSDQTLILYFKQTQDRLNYKKVVKVSWIRQLENIEDPKKIFLRNLQVQAI